LGVEAAIAEVLPTPDTGVLVLQMGGPATLHEVRPFIRRMLSDPAIVPMPAVFRVPLAALVSWLRSRRVRRHYEAIGGGSPITRISLMQAARLEEALLAAGRPMPVLLGQRYTAPTIGQAFRRAVELGLRRLIVLPLYPQYSGTTTGSAFAEVRRVARREAPGTALEFIEDYADHPGYARAVAETIREALQKVSPGARARTRVLFSAHGLPVRMVGRGDPYPARVQATVEAVLAQMGPREVEDHRVCFQSRVGPVRWIEPDTRHAIREAARDGVPALVLVPISFVSDHLETLYELDIQYREEAIALGVREFVRAASLNDSRAFAGALAQVVLARYAAAIR